MFFTISCSLSLSVSLLLPLSLSLSLCLIFAWPRQRLCNNDCTMNLISIPMNPSKILLCVENEMRIFCVIPSNNQISMVAKPGMPSNNQISMVAKLGIPSNNQISMVAKLGIPSTIKYPWWPNKGFQVQSNIHGGQTRNISSTFLY